MPFLRVNRTNDFAYPLDSYQKSYRLPGTSARWRCGPDGSRARRTARARGIHAFRTLFKGGAPHARVTVRGWRRARPGPRSRRSRRSSRRSCFTGQGKWQVSSDAPAKVTAARPRRSRRRPVFISTWDRRARPVALARTGRDHDRTHVPCWRFRASRALVSPEVKADKTVTFRLRAPKAVEVVLNGEWKGGGKLAMMKDEQGVWSITVGPLEPDLYGYSFSVDGMTVTDPVNSVLKPMRSPRTSVVDVPGDPPRLHDYQDVPRGTVRLHEYASKALGRRRPLRVYTPPATTRSRPRRGRCSISSTARATTRRPGRRSAART